MSAVEVPAGVADAAERLRRALDVGALGFQARSDAAGDLRRVVDWVLAASEAEPAGSVRFEWGHRYAIAEDRDRHRDGNRVWPCHPDGASTAGPCDVERMPGGEWAAHVWRWPGGKWRTGTPPEEGR